MHRRIDVNFDDLIYSLLCMYAFFIPLEGVLDQLFNIDTIFKPYRILAMVILLTFVIKIRYRWDQNVDLKKDIFLYLIFVYGIIITAYRMVTSVFKLTFLYNDAFQIGLYLGVFIVMRHINLSLQRILTIAKYLAAGAIVNGGYILYNFYILRDLRRHGGFMDNANYLALSLCVAIVLLLLQYRNIQSIYKRVFWWLLLIYLGNIFIIAGSRTGLLVLIICAVITIYFVPLRQKLILLAVGAYLISFSLNLDRDKIYGTGLIVMFNRVAIKTTEDDRIPLWKGVIRSSVATNFMGLGIGQFKGRFREFYPEENNDLIRRVKERNYYLSPHSDYFSLLAVYGIIGLIAYLVFLFMSAKEILIKLFQPLDMATKSYYQYSLLILLSLVVFSITAETFSSPLFWILLGTSTKTKFLPDEQQLSTG